MRRILWLVLLLFSGQLYAAPSLSNYSGTLSNGTEITLTGTAMGSKTTARPLKYEDFEAGTFISTWTNTNTLSIGSVVSEQRWTGSNKNVAGNITDATRHSEFTETNTVYPSWYVQFWVKISTDFAFGTPCAGFGCANQFFSNVKIIRFWNPGSEVDNFYISYDGNGDQLFNIAESVSGESTHFAYQNLSTNFTKGQWHPWQCEFKESSSLGAGDGVVRLWIDGTLVINRTDVVTRDGSDVYKRPFIIGFQDEWGSGSNGDSDPNHFWYDDIVVDNDWTRFEISTCSTYAQAGCKREYQRLNSVSATSSKFIFNQGNLQNGANVYGWWTDSNGVQNATGLAMTVGNTGSSTTQLNPSIGTPTQTSLVATWTPVGTSQIGVLATDAGFTSIVSTGTETTPKSYPGLSCGTTYQFEVKVSSEASYVSSTSGWTAICTVAAVQAIQKLTISGGALIMQRVFIQ